MLHSLREDVSGNPFQSSPIYLTRLRRVATKQARFEHLQARHRKALTARKDLARLLRSVGPLVACAGIEQHRNNK